MLWFNGGLNCKAIDDSSLDNEFAGLDEEMSG